MKPTGVRFFKTADAFRAWLERNHDKRDELWVGFYKKASGKSGMSRDEAVDLALCFGWIDGQGGPVDADSHATRFTPRKPKSYWSEKNIKRVRELTDMGLMHPAGLEVFERRDRSRKKLYSHEQKEVAFDAASLRAFKAKRKAWAFFSEEAPSYRRQATWWVMSAKRPETKAKRLRELIECSARNERLPALRPRRATHAG